MASRTESAPTSPGATHGGLPAWAAASALLAWAACLLLLVYFLELRPRAATRAPAVDTVPTARTDFPAPPRGAVVYARPFGRDALALGVLRRGDQVIAQASVVGPDGTGVTGLDVAFESSGSTFTAPSCGPGCYRAEIGPVVDPRAIDVLVDGDTTNRWAVTLPSRWPPPPAASIMRGADRAWRSLRSLSYEETLDAGLGSMVTSSWRIQSPDRLAYTIADGPSAVVIGNRRWDRSPGSSWAESAQSRIEQPVPPWAGATNAHLVGRTAVDGRPALVATFFDPTIPAWFRVVLDRATLRTVDLRMVATSHFMHDRLHSFDETPPIRPPVASR